MIHCTCHSALVFVKVLAEFKGSSGDAQPIIFTFSRRQRVEMFLALLYPPLVPLPDGIERACEHWPTQSSISDFCAAQSISSVNTIRRHNLGS